MWCPCFNVLEWLLGQGTHGISEGGKAFQWPCVSFQLFPVTTLIELPFSCTNREKCKFIHLPSSTFSQVFPAIRKLIHLNKNPSVWEAFHLQVHYYTVESFMVFCYKSLSVQSISSNLIELNSNGNVVFILRTPSSLTLAQCHGQIFAICQYPIQCHDILL